MQYFRRSTSARAAAVALRRRRCLAAFCGFCLAGWGGIPVRAETVTGSQTVVVAIGPAGKVQVVQPQVSLVRTGNAFTSFTGAVTVQYKVRTTAGWGNGTMTVQAAGDFTPIGGPKIANGDLRYTCGSATLGTPCSGVQTVSTATQTNVVSVGAGICTGPGCPGADPNSVSLSLTLENSPAFETGQFATTLTFSFSSL
jgi:hypothetical protein